MDLSSQSTLADLVSRLSGNQGVSTLVVLAVAVAMRYFAFRYIDRSDGVQAEQRRRLRANARNVLFFATVLALVVVWAPALRTFVLSIAAFTVAIILATKELILCLSGTMIATAGNAMRIGSWIEVGAVRGEVVDHTLMTTTIQELGRDQSAYAFTGRTIVLPNSLFLTVPVVNERFHKRFVFHTMPLTIDPSLDPALVSEAMRTALQEALADSGERAQRYLQAVEKRADVTMPRPEPGTRVTVQNDGKVKIVATAFMPTHEVERMEQAALTAGLAAVRAQLAT